MMKFKGLSLLLILAACGGDHPPGNSLGQLRSYDPIVMNDTEVQRLTSICTALSSKSNFLFASGSSSYNFAIQESKCGVPVTNSPVTVPVSLQPPSMVFQRTDVPAAPFVFPQVETTSTGVMSTICADLSRPTSPRNIGGKPTWISTTQTLDCVPGANEICLLMESGSGEAENQVKITKQEWIKFNVTPGTPQTGFWTGRQLTTSEDCTSTQNSAVSARLL